MLKMAAIVMTAALAACAADPDEGVPMAHVPASTFWMGCNSAKDNNCKNDENPQHKVTLAAFDIDVTETTVAQYKKCVSAGKCTVPAVVQPSANATWPGLTGHPINFLTWDQARQYCQWRGAGFDLPTEAQWELAARGSCEKNGSTSGDLACSDAMRTWPWGEASATCALAATSDCNATAPVAVGTKPGGNSPYGVKDMAGNVWEWTRDWYDLYAAGDQIDPALLSGVYDLRAARGGSYVEGAQYVRSSSRGAFSPTALHAYNGMRCVKGP